MSQLVVVFELRSRWAPELQRQFAGEEVRIRACRSLRDLDGLLADSPGSIAILDLLAGPAVCLQFLARHGGHSPQTPIVVVGSCHTAELEWPIRELGATEFLPAPTGERLAAVCRRQWQHAATSGQ